jgi:hypothetical protein
MELDRRRDPGEINDLGLRGSVPRDAWPVAIDNATANLDETAPQNSVPGCRG